MRFGLTILLTTLFVTPAWAVDLSRAPTAEELAVMGPGEICKHAEVRDTEAIKGAIANGGLKCDAILKISSDLEKQRDKDSAAISEQKRQAAARAARKRAERQRQDEQIKVERERQEALIKAEREQQETVMRAERQRQAREDAYRQERERAERERRLQAQALADQQLRLLQAQEEALKRDRRRRQSEALMGISRSLLTPAPAPRLPTTTNCFQNGRSFNCTTQ